MTPEVKAALEEAFPRMGALGAEQRRYVEARIQYHHARGERAFVRSTVIAESAGVVVDVTDVMAPRREVNKAWRTGRRDIFVTPTGGIETEDHWNGATA